MSSLTTFKKQIPNIINTNFTSIDYKKIQFLSNSFIYLDPPYKNTTGYTVEINYGEYYKWVLEISKNNFVIASEYNMPNNFTCFYKIPVKQSLAANNNKNNFVIASEYNMPSDFICFYKIPIKQSLAANNNKKEITDNLYYCNGLFKDWFENKEEFKWFIC